MAFAASGTLTVAAIVPLSNGNCSVTTAQNIAFGALNPLVPQSVVSAAGSLTYTCKGLGHAGATVSVTLSSPTPLTLKHSGSPTYNIPYLVELPSASFVPGNGSGIISIPITAQLYGTDYQLAPAGSYTDAITVQLNP